MQLTKNQLHHAAAIVSTIAMVYIGSYLLPQDSICTVRFSEYKEATQGDIVYYYLHLYVQPAPNASVYAPPERFLIYNVNTPLNATLLNSSFYVGSVHNCSVLPMMSLVSSLKLPYYMKLQEIYPYKRSMKIMFTEAVALLFFLLLLLSVSLIVSEKLIPEETPDEENALIPSKQPIFNAMHKD